MNTDIKKEILIGLIIGIICFFVIVLPTIHFVEWVNALEIGQKISRLYDAVIYYFEHNPNSTLYHR